MIRDFAKHVVTLAAESGGEPIRATKRDKQTWVLAPTDGPIRFGTAFTPGTSLCGRPTWMRPTATSTAHRCSFKWTAADDAAVR